MKPKIKVIKEVEIVCPICGNAVKNFWNNEEDCISQYNGKCSYCAAYFSLYNITYNDKGEATDFTLYVET